MDALIPIAELTDRQLILHLLSRTELLMADLNESVAALQAAVDDIGTRFASQITPLQEALAAAQAEADRLAAEGVLEDAAALDTLNGLLADASSAADEINSQVTELNAIGAAPADGGGDVELPLDEPQP